jgi:hypothetical protein
MARNRVYGKYTTDKGTVFARPVAAADFASAPQKWVAAPAGSYELPRHIKPRKVHGVSTTTQRRASVVIGDVTADLWTGVAATFAGFGLDGSADTYAVTGQTGEKALVSH